MIQAFIINDLYMSGFSKCVVFFYITQFSKQGVLFFSYITHFSDDIGIARHPLNYSITRDGKQMHVA